jgi:hypothetical protein
MSAISTDIKSRNKSGWLRSDLRNASISRGMEPFLPIGDTAYAECTALHRGRTTMVWQTKITRSDGKLAALVTQTQLVFPARPAK